MNPIDLFVVVYAGLAGLLVASFLNVAIYRLPHGETIVRGHSHCMSCGHALGALDLVPVFSYLLLGCRCRYCRAPISGRYMTVETAGVAYFTLAALAHRPFDGPWPLVSLLISCAIFCLLMVDAMIRFDGHERAPAAPGLIALALAGLTTLAAGTGFTGPGLGFTGSGLDLTGIGLRLAGLALGLLVVPALGRVMRTGQPLPSVPALPVSGLLLGLPTMLAVLAPVLALLAVAATAHVGVTAGRAAQAAEDNADAAAMPASGKTAAAGKRLAPLAGFILLAIMSLLTA